MTDIAILVIIVFAASLLQGTAGFGFALLAVPLLALILPFATVVPVIVILSTVTNLLVAGERREALRLYEILPLLLAGIAGIPLGVWILGRLNPEVLKIAVGCIIVGTAVCMLRDWRIPLRGKAASFITAGLLSGVLNGSLSMSGPPIILFMTNEGYGRDSFRANLTFYGILTNLAAIAAFGAGGMLTPDVWKAAGSGFVPLLAGSTLGIFLSGKIREGTFRKSVLALLIVMSAVAVARGISSLA